MTTNPALDVVVGYSWLDKVIAEQAAYYGMTPEKHAKLMGGAAEYQEKIDNGEVREPRKERK